MQAQQRLLITVVAAHQHADFIVMMETRQRELMAQTLVLRDIV